MNKVELGFKVFFEEKVSKKTGELYSCMVVQFPNGYEKVVFLDTAEKFLIETIVS